MQQRVILRVEVPSVENGESITVLPQKRSEDKIIDSAYC
jgi:hypothetical protein